MKLSSIVIVLLFSVALSKISSSDSCYRFERTDKENYDTFRQYYINKKGVPVAHDLITVERDIVDGVKHNKFSHYYHSELSNCKLTDNTYLCTETVVIFDISKAKDYATCDSIFQEKYADITKYGCTTSDDPFQIDKLHIGVRSDVSISMSGNVPLARENYVAVDSCEINREILGLTSYTTLIIVIVCVVVVVLLLLIFIIAKMKGKSSKKSGSHV